VTKPTDRPWDAGEPYPWRGHVLRHLGLVLNFDEDTLVTTMPIGPHVLTADSHLLLGALGLLVDLPAGVLSIQSIRPDWTVTFDVDCHLNAQPVHGDELTSVARIVRKGRNNVITETRVTDGSGEPIGQALVTFTRLPRTEGMNAVPPSGSRNALVDPVPPAGRSNIDDYMGFRIDRASGTLSFEPGRAVANALGAIQGGVTISAMSSAAASVASDKLGKTATSRDIHVYYTGLGTTGPYQVRTEILRDTEDDALVRCELVDTGAEERLLALGTVSTRAT